MFFFEKKNQKTFPLWRTWPGQRMHPITEVFCVFFSERKTLLLVVLLLAAAPDPVIAIRGNDQMTLSQVRALIASADPQTRAKLTSDPKALQDLIRNALLQKAVLEAAHAANWERRPDVAALLARTRDAAITQSFLASRAVPPAAYPNAAELQAAYEQAKPQLMQPRSYHLTQLFVTLPANASAAETDQAKRTLAGLRDGFASAHAPKLPAGVQSSDLGWVPENHLQPAAKDAVAGLLEGQVSPPVCTQPGCAILKLVATRPAGPAPLDQVRDGLIRLMRQQKERQGEQAFANILLAKQPVRIDEIQLSHLAGQ
jgi:peptidylprolyl isomerase